VFNVQYLQGGGKLATNHLSYGAALSLSFTIIRSQKVDLLIFSVHYNAYCVDISMTNDISKIYALHTYICLDSYTMNAYDCMLTCTSVYGIIYYSDVL
jgi:hypothetical protein